jgi:hypothetical protein
MLQAQRKPGEDARHRMGGMAELLKPGAIPQRSLLRASKALQQVL